MPKKILQIKAFEGGLNTVKAERDIEENESPFIVNADVSNQGNIKILGTCKDNYISTSDSITVPENGYGFFTFAHDYDMLSGGDTFKTPPGLVDTVYLCRLRYDDGGDKGYIAIYDYTNGFWHDTAILFDVSASDAYRPNFYVIDGALRVCNSAEPTHNVMWFGHIKRDLFGDSTNHSLNLWKLEYAKIRPPKAVHILGADPNTYGQIDLAPFASKLFVVDDLESIDDNQYTANSSYGASSDGVHVMYEFVADSTATSTWTNAPSNTIHFYITALYDGVLQESATTRISQTAGQSVGGENQVLKLAFSVTTGANGSYMTRIRKRCTGFRLYYSETSNPAGTKYLLVEGSFENGLRKAGSPDWDEWNVYSSRTGYEDTTFEAPDTAFSSVGAYVFKDPPIDTKYDDLNGHFEHETTTASWKTSCTIGRRLYIGNVFYPANSTGRPNNDLILKSAPEQFDKFPEFNTTEAAVSDGESIVSLMSFADRILQFKKSTLYIINISGDSEFLEAKYPFMGIEQPYQVCETIRGIFWINLHGLFWYNGEQILNLMEQKLSKDSWKWTGYGAIGYDNINEKLIITRDTRKSDDIIAANGGDGVGELHDFSKDIWIFNLKLNSWTEGKNLIDGDSKKTNWVNTPANTDFPSGALVYSLDGVTGNTATLDLLPSGTSDIAYVVNATVGTTTDASDYNIGGDFAISVTTDGSVNTAEETSITFRADSAGNTNGKYFNIYSANDAITYYVWHNVDSGGNDPAPTGETGIAIDVATNDTASTIANAAAIAIDAVEDFGVINTGAYIKWGFKGKFINYPSTHPTETQEYSPPAYTSAEWRMVLDGESHFIERAGSNTWNGDASSITDTFDKGEFFEITNSKIDYYGTYGENKAGIFRGIWSRNLTCTEAGSDKMLMRKSGTTSGSNDAIYNYVYDAFDQILLTNDAEDGQPHTVEDFVADYGLSGSEAPTARVSYSKSWLDASATDGATWTATLIDTGAGETGIDAMMANATIEITCTEGAGQTVVNTTTAFTLSSGNLMKWTDVPTTTDKFHYFTRDIDFGDPSRRKKISKIYITFRSIDSAGSYADSNVLVRLHIYSTDGEAVIDMDNSSINYNTSTGLSSDSLSTDSDGWLHSILTLSSTDLEGGAISKNILSAQIQLYTADGSFVPSGFQINDLSISYREKSVK